MTVWMLFLYQFWNTSFRNKAESQELNLMKTFAADDDRVSKYSTKLDIGDRILEMLQSNLRLPEKPSR